MFPNRIAIETVSHFIVQFQKNWLHWLNWCVHAHSLHFYFSIKYHTPFPIHINSDFEQQIPSYQYYSFIYNIFDVNNYDLISSMLVICYTMCESFSCIIFVLNQTKCAHFYTVILTLGPFEYHFLYVFYYYMFCVSLWECFNNQFLYSTIEFAIYWRIIYI